MLRFGGHERELRGSEENTTNNRMELLAAISALEAMTEPCKVVLRQTLPMSKTVSLAGFVTGKPMVGKRLPESRLKIKIYGKDWILSVCGIRLIGGG